MNEQDEHEPQPGALDDDLLPRWHVLGGVARSWRLIAIFFPDEPALCLQREVWRAPARGSSPRWLVPEHDKMPLNPEQTAKLMKVLAKPRQVRTLTLCESESLVLHPDQLYRFEVRPGCARCAELARIGAP